MKGYVQLVAHEATRDLEMVPAMEAVKTALEAHGLEVGVIEYGRMHGDDRVLKMTVKGEVLT